MEHLMTRQLDLILREGGASYDGQVTLPVSRKKLDTKAFSFLNEILRNLGGLGDSPLLEKINFDFQLEKHVLIWDDELEFQRYRGTTLKSEFYLDHPFSFVEGHKRLCRTFEKEALKVGLLPRVWAGPPLAERVFGSASPSGDFFGNGATGWKLKAYTSFQIDLLSIAYGYSLIRLSPYETLMTGGSLKRLDQLLINPKEEQRSIIYQWLMRKLGKG